MLGSVSWDDPDWDEVMDDQNEEAAEGDPNPDDGDEDESSVGSVKTSGGRCHPIS
jgi:hypothetical protein